MLKKQEKKYMNKPKIILFVPVWLRHDILAVWHEGVKRLQTSKDFDFKVMAVVSCASDLKWCYDRDIPVTPADNKPLGRKQNTGLQSLKDVDFDYICQLSSDLLLAKPELYLPAIKEGYDMIGFDRALFMDGKSKDAVRFIKGNNHKMIGACRLISKRVIEKCGWKLWDDDLNRNLDHSSQQRILRHGTYKVIKKDAVVGIKSDIQITSWKTIKRLGKEVDVQVVYDMLSEKEVELIKKL